MFWRPICHFVFVILLGLTVAFGGDAVGYGTKVPFTKNAELHFPDFVLTYVGERRVASDRYPRGFQFHDFRVTTSKGSQTVSWSSGTGDIGPAPFAVNGARFTLELSHADHLGRLKPAELVIQRAR